MKKLVTLALLILCACSPVRHHDNELVVARGEGKDQWWDALPRASWSRFEKVIHSQPWFEVYRVADGVLAIYEPGQFEEVVSYLITGSRRALLFDSGLGIGDMAALVAELSPLEVTVINSHSHYDHIGGNHQFDEVLGHPASYARQRAAGLGHDEVAEFVGPGWIWKQAPAGFDAADYEIRSFTPARLLRDGERIDLGGRTIEVMFTPGHSPDSLCLIDRDARILFTGDTFYAAPLYTHLPGSDFEAYRRTAAALAALGKEIDTLMPGHNDAGLSAEYLPRLRDAFEAIAAGSVTFRTTDGHREYDFKSFSIITAIP